MPEREQDWRDAAECRDVPTTVFYPVDNWMSLTATKWDARGYDEAYEAAKHVCSSCPVKEACLEFAMETDQRDGVWGGLTELELRAERVRRRKARRSAS